MTTVTLRLGTEGHTRVVPRDMVQKWKVIKDMMEDLEETQTDASEIPIAQLTPEVGDLVIAFARLSPEEKDELERYRDKHRDRLIPLTAAANYLDYPELLDFTTSAIADMIRGKTPDEIRQTFHIQNDFTPEEEAAVQKEMQWISEEA